MLKEKLNEVVALINAQIPSAKAILIEPDAEQGAGDCSILIENSQLFSVCEFLKSNSKYPHNVLQVISGVDYVEYIEVCYMLANFHVDDHRDLILKTRVSDRIDPRLDSVCSLWPAANYQERECYDMLGVSFNNHPDHRRILCPDDWQGFPLRKDYVAAKYYNNMEVYPDNKMNFEDREFIVRQKMIEAQAQAKASQENN